MSSLTASFLLSARALLSAGAPLCGALARLRTLALGALALGTGALGWLG
jgi:hypothetical protein